MHESEFGRRSYGRLKFGTKFGCRGSTKFHKKLRNFAKGCEIFSQGLRNFATPVKIFVGLRNFPAFSILIFFSFFSCLIHLKTVTKH